MDFTVQSKQRVKSLCAQATALEEKFENEINAAVISKNKFNAEGDEAERKNSVHMYGMAWKTGKKILSVKEQLRAETSALSQAQRYLHDQADPDDTSEAKLHAADAEYYYSMSKRAAAEHDEYVKKCKSTIESIAVLRTKAPKNTIVSV